MPAKKSSINFVGRLTFAATLGPFTETNDTWAATASGSTSSLKAKTNSAVEGEKSSCQSVGHLTLSERKSSALSFANFPAGTAEPSRCFLLPIIENS